MNTVSRRRNRIIVALDAVDPRDVALEIARHLRNSTAYEFLGLFVEDTYILNHAQSSLAREVMLSGKERPLERDTLERQMRAQSSKVRQRFEATASELGLLHSFRVARGELLTELVEHAHDADALVLSLTKNSIRLNELVLVALERLAEAPVPLLLLAREGWLSGASILVLVSNPGLEHTVIQTAARLAKQSQSPLTLILTGEALRKRETSMAEIACDLEAEDMEPAGVIPLANPSGPALVQVARNNHARLLVIPSPAPFDPDLIAEMGKKLPSALMIIRS